MRRVGQRHRLLEGERDRRAAAPAEPGPGPPGHLPRAARTAELARGRAAGQIVEDALTAIAALENQRAQGWLDQLRTILATETGKWHRPASPAARPARRCCFPRTRADVVLAQLTGITLTTAADGTRTASVTGIDTSVRWNHVPTATIVELLAALAGSGRRVGHRRGQRPRIDPSTAAWDGDSIVVSTSGTILSGTLPAAPPSRPSIPPTRAADGAGSAHARNRRGTLTFAPRPDSPSPTAGLSFRSLVRGAARRQWWRARSAADRQWPSPASVAEATVGAAQEAPM